MVSLKKALLGPYFLAGFGGVGVPLDCHEEMHGTDSDQNLSGKATRLFSVVGCWRRFPFPVKRWRPLGTDELTLVKKQLFNMNVILQKDNVSMKKYNNGHNVPILAFTVTKKDQRFPKHFGTDASYSCMSFPSGKIAWQGNKDLHSLKLTVSPLKMDGWKITFLLGWPIFRGHVSFREAKISHRNL